jgi:phage tail sheath protein FI
MVVGLEARDPGTWGDQLEARVDYATRDTADTTLYNLTVRDTDPTRGSEEVWRNVSTDAGSLNRLDRVLADSRLVRSVAGTTLDARPTQTTAAVRAKGGSEGGAVNEADVQGEDGVVKSGIYALRATDIFTILCLPPLTRQSAFAGALMSAAAVLCLQRRAMLLVDAPPSWTDADIAVDRSDRLQPAPGTDEARNAAVYFPWIRLPDENGRVLAFPPSGAVAGIWARNDGQRNVAKAPAGTETGLSGVTELTVKLTDAENGRINPLGINCLRTFPVIGSVVWGARTRKGADRLADQWKYVPVRRTALFIEETLYRATQWVVFEPNDEPLWASIRLNVGAFMNSQWRQGMFQGRTPQQAYLVKCDGENNPQNDIDRGIVNILVGFAPLKPAEFVLVHIQQLSPALQV